MQNYNHSYCSAKYVFSSDIFKMMAERLYICGMRSREQHEID